MVFDCLIVDDEEEIAKGICDYFNIFDLSSAYVTDYQSGIDFLEHNKVALLLLDINLGEESGFLFCKQVRQYSNIPIIFISARNREQDILSGLSLGGDDYITKPFSMNILLAKVKAILRRNAGSKETSEEVAFGEIRIERAAQRLYRNNQLIRLKPMEWKLLMYFLDHQNRVISKEELLSHVWEDTYINEGTISSHVRHLREKIEQDPNHPVYIKTSWGTGYLSEMNESTGKKEGM